MIDKKYITHKKEPFFDIAKKFIKPGHKVLDIGTGNGAFAKFCGRDDFYLFDGNQETIDDLSKLYKNVVFGRLPTLTFDDECFDIIHCSHVIEHLKPQELYDTLKEVDRCLSKDGYFIISTPLFWGNFFSDLSHVKPYNPEVFYKYLVDIETPSPTRKKISNSYSKVLLQYRYKEVSLTQDLYNLNNSLLIKVLIKVLNLLYKLGLRKYIITGYTLVLKK